MNRNEPQKLPDPPTTQTSSNPHGFKERIQNVLSCSGLDPRAEWYERPSNTDNGSQVYLVACVFTVSENKKLLSKQQVES